jgi:hypothetical protein
VISVASDEKMNTAFGSFLASKVTIPARPKVTL